MTPVEYKAAWDAIPAMKWNRKERFDWQIKLLKEWAEKDLEGALKAAFAESWSSNRVVLVRGEAFNYHGAVVESIKNRPQDILKLVQDRKLGTLESSLLLQAWSVTWFQHDPKIYFSHLRGLKSGEFPLALNASFLQAEDFNTLTQVLDLAEDKVRQGVSMEGLQTWMMSRAASDFTKDELMDRLNTPDAQLRDYYILAMVQRATRSGLPARPEDISAHIREIPEDRRSHFAGLLLTFSDGNPGITQASLDHFVSENDWKYLGIIDASRVVQKMAEKADLTELAEWAATLPPREETNGMFRTGVEPFIRKSPEQAWEWIQEMNPGYWRDRALAEYSQVNLTVFNDPEKSAAALSQIRDPEVLKSAQVRRKGWEEGQDD
ncbi:MAG: hypothetical protein EOP85_00845 [Verrucomicrobiaceae bacterium]|nr:MAG: hypothetical protein EOP85_00845 [Verrucomicrobiaceae bacterium]